MNLLHLKVVLASIAADDSSNDVLRGARALTDASGGQLHVLHVAAGGSAETTHSIESLLGRAGVASENVTMHRLAGEPSSVIRSLADRIRADVIVLGRHRGRAAKRPGMGSTALAVVTNSWAPCLILSERLRLPLERVLVPLDLSDTSRGALVVALSWASALRAAERRERRDDSAGVVLTALVVKSPARAGVGDDERSLDDELARLRHDAGAWAHVDIDAAVVWSNDVTGAIADHAGEQESDLVVLGTRGLGSGAVGRLGSVSLGVAQRLTTPILLVPPAVWTTHAAQPYAEHRVQGD